MAKIKEVKYINEETGNEWHDPQCLFWCLGCGCEHAFSPKIHRFNGDLNNPTVTPSLLHSWDSQKSSGVCHSYITNGRIKYLNDCHHHLKGQTVELPDVDEMIAARGN